MLDIFIGKPPTMNRHLDETTPIQKTVREVLRIARNVQFDRRKNTTDRRRRNEDFTVSLSHRLEKRARPDRRQNQGLLSAVARMQDRRQNRLDRRRSVNSGVHVKLSTQPDRRSGFDRRGNKLL
ncbi:MAG: hypothetical protein AB1461_02590 [Thermodesulfobacteriota bacterium]